MSSKLSPKYWDENPELFIKDLAQRLAIQEPVTCAKIWDAVISMIQWTGCYADMCRTEREIQAAAMERATELIKAAINDAMQFFGDSGWEFCDRWGLDENEWSQTLDRIIELVRYKHKRESEETKCPE